MSSETELYGRSDCPYTAEAREHLQWRGISFVEYDVGADPEAHRRLLQLTAGRRIVPLLVEGGRVVEIGWRGRGCVVAAASPADRQDTGQ